jgi:hypothetical protein
MNLLLPAFTLVLLLLVTPGCQDSPEKRSMAGSYNYSGTLGDEGDTTAVAVTIGDQKGFAISCRTSDYCLRRAADLCAPGAPSILSTQNTGAEYGGGANSLPSANTLMQIACAK